MLWNEVIELGVATETVTNGEPLKTLAWTTVFADKKSIGSKEFYQGNNIGAKPEMVFTIRSIDLGTSEKVRYNSKIYDIVRTYVDRDNTEITVQGSVGE